MSKLPRVVSAAPKLQARATAARQVRRTTWLRRSLSRVNGVIETRPKPPVTFVTPITD